MVGWAKPKGAFERVGCNLRLSKRLLNMVSTLPADPAGFDLEFFSKGGPGSTPRSEREKHVTQKMSTPKSFLHSAHGGVGGDSAPTVRPWWLWDGGGVSLL